MKVNEFQRDDMVKALKEIIMWAKTLEATAENAIGKVVGNDTFEGETLKALVRQASLTNSGVDGVIKVVGDIIE